MICFSITIWGSRNEFVSSPRLDDLQCAFASLEGFLQADKKKVIAVHCVLDNEEVGSSTRQGAASTFLKDTLMRINMGLGRTQEEYYMALADSFMISADNAHAAFVLTWLFGYKDTNVSEKTESVEAVGDKSTTEKSNADDSVLYSVSEGTAILLSQVNDATFASEVLGKGIAVIPSKGEVVAPCDAVVETVFDTKHAVGLSTESGMELLIHIGINTVELNGKYFTSHVKNGDHVKKGQLLVSFDMEKVKAAGYDVTTPLIVTNSDDYKDVKILSEDSVTPSDKVLEIVK